MFKLHPYLGSAVAIVCVACGASFSANEGGVAAGGAGSSGETNGGATSFAGSSSIGDAGEPELGSGGAAGETSSAGAGGTATGAGGATAGRGGWGNAGWGNGGRWGGSGGWGGASTLAKCDALRQEYEAAVEKARLCDKGSIDQCSPSSVAQRIGGCGCPILINTKSEYSVAAKKAYQAYQDNKCDLSGPVCDVFCAPAVSASCAQQSTGPGSAFVCTAGAVVN